MQIPIWEEGQKEGWVVAAILGSDGEVISAALAITHVIWAKVIKARSPARLTGSMCPQGPVLSPGSEQR